MLEQSESDKSESRTLVSCIRSRNENSPKKEPRKVSFPEDESQLVTGYLEPANPWEYGVGFLGKNLKLMSIEDYNYAESVNREELISTYKTSCEKHGTVPISQVLNQLQAVDLEGRNECLDLHGENLGSSSCESLEEVLKRVQFRSINLESTSLDDEGSVALFDMLEYYESATHLNISGNRGIGVRGWQACSRMIKKTQCLEQLEARGVTLNEQFMPILSRALRIGTQLQVLKLENCSLSGRPVIILAAALKLNSGLKELYLADNGLNVTDAIQLGGLLRSNTCLQLLDISNNNIQDTGLGHISDGLMEQANQPNSGLSILILWNNQLTSNSAKHFARALAKSQSLETLNIGQNMLTNECLYSIKDALQQNRILLRLGMQSTHLTCEGAITLAECIADNPVIERIDLRDNDLKVAGLMALARSMQVNTSVTQLDLDERNIQENESNLVEQYRNLLKEIRGYCLRNEDSAKEKEDTLEEESSGPVVGRKGGFSSVTSRKISLTCETLLRSAGITTGPSEGTSLLTEPRRGASGRLRSPAPSPIPSPVSSPVPSPSRTRFQVSKVAESSSPATPPSLSSSPSRFFASPTTSRFRVTLVEPLTAPTVTGSSSSITVGFTTSSSQPSPAAPAIVVTTTGIAPAVETPAAVTLKLDGEADNLIIESETAADMEVQHYMCSEDKQDNMEVSSSKHVTNPWLGTKQNNTSEQTRGLEISSAGSAGSAESLSNISQRREVSQMFSNSETWGGTDSKKNIGENAGHTRSRKISWISPLTSDTSQQRAGAMEKTPSSLEKLLGLFQNPGSFFGRSQLQQQQQQQPPPSKISVSSGFLFSNSSTVGAVPDIINNNKQCGASNPTAASVPEKIQDENSNSKDQADSWKEEDGASSSLEQNSTANGSICSDSSLGKWGSQRLMAGTSDTTPSDMEKPTAPTATSSSSSSSSSLFLSEKTEGEGTAQACNEKDGSSQSGTM